MFMRRVGDNGYLYQGKIGVLKDGYGKATFYVEDEFGVSDKKNSTQELAWDAH